MKNIIMFCSAPADVQYMLSIYDKNVDKSKISIYITSVKGIYKFLSILDLKLDNMVFIPYTKDLSFKRFQTIVKEKLRLNKIYIKYFKNIENSKIYFFSHFYDWITFSFLVKLYRRNEIIFIDHYDSISASNFKKNKNNLKDFITLLIYRYLTNTKFNFLVLEDSKRPEFHYEKYGIKRIELTNIDDGIYEKYSYKIDLSQGNLILFFESDHSKQKIIKNYNEKIIEIIKALKNKGYKIYLKPHPRLGFSKILSNYVFEVLPDFIPGEFINAKNFNAILGVETYALTSFTRRGCDNVYSLINLFNFPKKIQKEYYKTYLNNLSEGKIKFINSLDNLCNNIVLKK